MKTHEKNNKEQPSPITCPICQREFKFKNAYRKHYASHLETTREEFEENMRFVYLLVYFICLFVSSVRSSEESDALRYE